MNITGKGAAVVLTVVLLAASAASTPAVEVLPDVQLKGYLQNRVYVAPGANPQYRVYLVSVSTTADLPNESNAYIEVNYQPWASSSGLYLESAYYDTPVGSGRLRIGKGRRLSFGITSNYSNRRTSNYGLFSNAFTRDRIQGIQYYDRTKNYDFDAGIYTALRLGIRNIGEVPGDTIRNTTYSVPHLSLRDSPGSLSRKLQVSARLGGKWYRDTLKVGISASYASLDDTDLKNLQGTGDESLRPVNPLTGTSPTAPIGPVFTIDSMSQIALDFRYSHPNGLVLQGEWVDSSVSDLDYDVWYALAGWRQQEGWSFYARYGKQDMDIVPTNNPLTWDMQQLSISAVQQLRKSLWLQYEYESNTEDTNTGAKVRNNLFFIELYTGF